MSFCCAIPSATCSTRSPWRASSKKLELAYEVHPDVPDALVGDVNCLRQVAVNLVGNAIKFTDTGEVVDPVAGLAERAGDDLVLEVRVRDAGRADDAAAARLFRPLPSRRTSATPANMVGLGWGSRSRVNWWS